MDARLRIGIGACELGNDVEGFGSETYLEQRLGSQQPELQLVRTVRAGCRQPKVAGALRRRRLRAVRRLQRLESRGLAVAREGVVESRLARIGERASEARMQCPAVRLAQLRDDGLTEQRVPERDPVRALERDTGLNELERTGAEQVDVSRARESGHPCCRLVRLLGHPPKTGAQRAGERRRRLAGGQLFEQQRVPARSIEEPRQIVAGECRVPQEHEVGGVLGGQARELDDLHPRSSGVRERTVRPGSSARTAPSRTSEPPRYSSTASVSISAQ